MTVEHCQGGNCSLLLAKYGGDQGPAPAVVAVLAEVDTLPSSEIQAAICDWNSEGGSKERRL
jgi:hypothetical protein